MLNRSRSWPVQSMVTLDPRGIVYLKIQAQADTGFVSRGIPERVTTPDVVLEANANERTAPYLTKPDIFPRLESSNRLPTIGVLVENYPRSNEKENIQLKFVDHYQPLDSVSAGREREFAVRIPSDRGKGVVPSKCPTNNQVPLSLTSLSLKSALDDSEKAKLSEICAAAETGLGSPTNRNGEGRRMEVKDEGPGLNKLLNSYQIDLLRKKSWKAKEESNYAVHRETECQTTKRRIFERKPTSEFESIASNDTKTTDCDDKSFRRKNVNGDSQSNPLHLIRSYSLGCEKPEEKPKRTFKKFSLPTPQLKDAEDDADGEMAVPKSKAITDVRKVSTLTRHYYPEGGWGLVIVACSVMVQILCHGLQLASGIIMKKSARKFHVDIIHTGWLGALSTAVALLLSPITIAFCRRKSTRVTAVVGGLVTALGCLFTSFASQFHQLFFSYGTVIGVGVGLTRDCSTLMVAQYFKRRRELVEIFIVSGSGLGISVMSASIQGAINAIGWRLGLQAITCAVFLTFILGTFYRSASLYHPQRRAILHLKNQKRKIKDKNKVEDKPAFLDTSTLRSKTVRILLASTGLSAFGINTPIFYLVHQAEEEGLGERAVLLQAYLGLAWVLGCAAFGLVVVHNSVECRIARQYLCQAAVFMCGLSILALPTVHGNYHGYVLFVWIYGIFCGGYHYSLKMYTYERVRARNFARTWGFVQCSQAIPIALGVPISGYVSEGCGGKAGYYFSSTCTLAGSIAMFLIDVHRRRIARHKHTRANGQKHLCESETCPQRRPSLGLEPEVEPPVQDLPVAELIPGFVGDKPELTCISEEGIADMDLPDNFLDDLDYIGITSCNKVENYLMLSEFENNLIAEAPVVLDKKGRKWSLAKKSDDLPEEGGRWRLVPSKRTITVIDEASI